MRKSDKNIKGGKGWIHREKGHVEMLKKQLPWKKTNPGCSGCRITPAVNVAPNVTFIVTDCLLASFKKHAKLPGFVMQLAHVENVYWRLTFGQGTFTQSHNWSFVRGANCCHFMMSSCSIVLLCYALNTFLCSVPAVPTVPVHYMCIVQVTLYNAGLAR